MFYLFAGYSYYPEGGVYDYVGSADTIEGAKDLILRGRGGNIRVDWWHITNEQMEIVESGTL